MCETACYIPLFASRALQSELVLRNHFGSFKRSSHREPAPVLCRYGIAYLLHHWGVCGFRYHGESYTRRGAHRLAEASQAITDRTRVAFTKPFISIPVHTFPFAFKVGDRQEALRQCTKQVLKKRMSIHSWRQGSAPRRPFYCSQNTAVAPLCPEYNCVCLLARGSSRGNWDDAVASPALFI